MKKTKNDPKLRLVRACCVVLLASTACSRAVRYGVKPSELQQPADWMNHRDPVGIPLIHRVVQGSCQTTSLEALLAQPGFDINAQDDMGRTALHLAAEYNLRSLAQRLLLGQIGLNIRDNQGLTALYTALEKNHLEVVQVLMVDPRIEVLRGKQDKKTFLGTVASYLPSFSKKFRYDCPVHKWNKILLETAFRQLELVFCKEYMLFLEKAFQAGEDVNAATNADGQTLLHRAAAAGRLNLVQALLKVPGIEVNAKDNLGCTALHEASNKGYTAVVRALLKAPGTDVNAPDTYGNTPLHEAVNQHRFEVMEVLLKKGDGINVNAEDNLGLTPLHTAVQKGYREMVRALLKAPGIDVHAQQIFGNTPFHGAASGNDVEMVQDFLETPGIDVNVRNGLAGESPLHGAARNSEVAVVETLLKVPGIKVDVANKQGVKPLEEVQELIEKNPKGKTAQEGLAWDLEEKKRLSVWDQLNEFEQNERMRWRMKHQTPTAGQLAEGPPCPEHSARRNG